MLCATIVLMAERINFLDGFDPTPRLTRVAHAVMRLVHFLPEQPLASHGDHFVNTGAAPMLDAAMEVQDGRDEPTL